ncbi:MAG: hypothetical protein LUK37_03190 [Clostridia bacterium]|nr:hypothetical protein [Clostridia bacterium]
MDKTIKSKTLGLTADAGAAALNSKLLSAMGEDAGAASPPDVWSLLGGFVACWKGNVPTGLYLSRLGYEKIQLNPNHSRQCTKICDPKGVEHDVLLLKGSMPVILELKKEQGDTFPRLFYTGDYDMHDLVQTIGSGRSIIPSDSPDEKRIINQMNCAIFNALKTDVSESYNKVRYDSMALTINHENRDEQEYQMIRHGAQVSYLAHMLAEERSEAIIYTIADKTHNEEIAAYSKNDGWVLLDPVTELNSWYEKNGVKLKMTWKNVDQLDGDIARSISNQIYREIQAARKNTVSPDWLVNAIHFFIKADEPTVKRITDLTIQELTASKTGARLWKTANGYERTVPIA